MVIKNNIINPAHQCFCRLTCVRSIRVLKRLALGEEGAEAGETLESNHSLNNLVVSFQGSLHPWKNCSQHRQLHKTW